MPKLLEEGNAVEEQIDADMTAAEEASAFTRLAERPGSSPDLSDGGMVGAARLTPFVGGRPSQTGRANARRAWTWQGSETVLPLAWNPDGTVHDGARAYLQKRACICCRKAGFKAKAGQAPICPDCSRNNCPRCKAGTDRSTVNKLQNGKTVKGFIVPCFYLKKDDVPFQEKFYGDIPCMIHGCIRVGSMGFKTETDMRMHARSRHRVEYQVAIETASASKTDEVAELRAMVNALLLKSAGAIQAPAIQAPAPERIMAPAELRAAKDRERAKAYREKRAREARQAQEATAAG